MGIIGYILGLFWDNGKENGNYRSYRGYIGIIGYILGFYRDNYYNGRLYKFLGIYWGDTGIMEKKMETNI